MSKPCLLSLSDEELIGLLPVNNDEVFSSLYRRYWGPLVLFAANYITDKDTCKEVVQEFFTSLLVKRSLVNIKTSVAAYLYNALRNYIFNYIRNSSVYSRHVKGAFRLGGQVFAENNVEQFVRMSELERTIDGCLVSMPLKYRQVYVLHFREYYTLRKTAYLLDRPVDTVEKQCRRAVKLIRDRLSCHR
ncbi:RNA polymerase sigma-70 factor, ECF subfamily [Filimonas lacunae]|uniref:RNA polymerase sigma-70 factor, ECF subfamily n=1 Tax=Filimonas lacunae TaxID=477680 RepID=A0A173MIY0_9BACT|nr:sigma-70 family RNA polymerase sigma factor [Filimonas lacunae]BAV07427.1 RNA polymerase ECF-type sigma factor [Filimonas lacunae]SIT30415.1 RNA polymerase sigma-70 factor, ECF subfamily [Filimonas lacunae]